ncbi:MAG: TraB/GumN family protein [Robiginitomaculum sp.]|nr:TraB/GumN family protein [Robiginitomaculum sp.]
MINFFTQIRTVFASVVMSLLVVTLAACDQGGNVKDKVAASHARYDGPAIWKVSDNDSTLYLFGTVHLMQPDINWQRRDMQAAFDDVGIVFFETPDDDKSALKTSMLQRQYGIYPGGERLQDHLDGININRLTAAAYNADVPLERLDNFRPWLAADILTVAGADKAGLRYENSADAVMRTKAVKAKKSIRALDTVEAYFDAVAKQPDWVQLRAFEQTIKNFNTLVHDTKSVNADWLIGNTERLETNVLAPARESSPELYAALFTARNKKWVRSLDEFMKGDTNAMVVAGIGHMLGEGGLPTRFEDLGFKVERVRRLDLPN